MVQFSLTGILASVALCSAAAGILFWARHRERAVINLGVSAVTLVLAIFVSGPFSGTHAGAQPDTDPSARQRGATPLQTARHATGPEHRVFLDRIERMFVELRRRHRDRNIDTRTVSATSTRSPDGKYSVAEGY